MASYTHTRYNLVWLLSALRTIKNRLLSREHGKKEIIKNLGWVRSFTVGKRSTTTLVNRTSYRLAFQEKLSTSLYLPGKLKYSLPAASELHITAQQHTYFRMEILYYDNKDEGAHQVPLKATGWTVDSLDLEMFKTISIEPKALDSSTPPFNVRKLLV